MTTPASEKRSRNKRATALVNEALAQYPDTPSRQLARMLMKSHPLVWHRADRDRCGIVKGLLILGRHNSSTLVSWPDGEETYETLTTITDERPSFDGPDHSEN